MTTYGAAPEMSFWGAYLMVKTEYLQRQARDKHRLGTLDLKKRDVSAEYFVRMMTAAAAAAEAPPGGSILADEEPDAPGPAQGEPGYTRDMMSLALDMD
jgi:hypothetical protein